MLTPHDSWAPRHTNHQQSMPVQPTHCVISVISVITDTLKSPKPCSNQRYPEQPQMLRSCPFHIRQRQPQSLVLPKSHACSCYSKQPAGEDGGRGVRTYASSNRVWLEISCDKLGQRQRAEAVSSGSATLDTTTCEFESTSCLSNKVWGAGLTCGHWC